MVVLQISTFVLKKLKNLPAGSTGYVYAIDEKEALTAVGIRLDESDEPADDLYVCASPEPIGWFESTADDRTIKSICDLIIQINPSTGDLYCTYEKKPLEYVEISEIDLASKYFVIRVRAFQPFSSELSEEGIRSNMEILTEKFDNIFIPEIASMVKDKQYVSSDTTKKYSSIKDIDIIDCSLYLNCSVRDEDTPIRAPIIDYISRTKECISMNLQIDTLTFLTKNLSILDLLEEVRISLVRCLNLQADCLVNQLKAGSQISVPQVYHFLPETAGHFVSLTYPQKTLDRDLVDLRVKLHKTLILPSDRPLLMRGNAFQFTRDKEGEELQNPHEAVGPSGVEGGEPVILEGRYAYHHYCQQGEDDNGWGCAYRSLQTLCSWFRLQGYTNRAVPTLKEIQQCLVSIGDKPSNFVGSRQWIGSTEVGFCLDTLLGVSSRIVSVSSGEDLGMKGGELSHHFRSQGTPVMIGGGNLAHTILGVDYNKKTGDIKFLILDPHYTGSEDLKTIVAKGWCGWKGLDFWKKSSFYNMCMPIRPKYI